MIWLKRLGYLVLGVLGLLVAAIGGIYLLTSLRMSKRYEVAARPITARADSAAMARGKHLAVAIGKCVNCHGEDLGGQLIRNDFMFGRLAAPNLTSGRGGLGDRYDDPGLARAIRNGLGPTGTSLRVMPSEAFQYLSDADVGALLGYIRALPPIDRVLPPTRIGPVARALSLFTTFPLIPARVVDHQRIPPAEVSEGPTPDYGKYLADVGGCTGCHGPGLSGGPVGPGRPSSNLTPTGIGSWTEEDFFRALRDGMRPSKTPIDSLAMPWPLAGKMSDLEIRAVWAFLKTVPAKEFGNR
jgi:mono/diheme cytochrome c family protein